MDASYTVLIASLLPSPGCSRFSGLAAAMPPEDNGDAVALVVSYDDDGVIVCCD